MQIDLDALSAAQRYFHIVQTLVPRPIAWVLSENGQGRYNLAPFSYFTAVSSDPPLLMISLGKKSPGQDKDTRVNIERRREFVVHIADTTLLEPVNASAATLPEEVSEVDLLGLEVVPFDGFRLPRLQRCRIAFGCECHDILEIGALPQALLFGRMRTLYIDDALCRHDEQGRLRVDVAALDPLARLGAGEYAGLGDIMKIERPP